MPDPGTSHRYCVQSLPFGRETPPKTLPLRASRQIPKRGVGPGRGHQPEKGGKLRTEEAAGQSSALPSPRDNPCLLDVDPVELNKIVTTRVRDQAEAAEIVNRFKVKLCLASARSRGLRL